MLRTMAFVGSMLLAVGSVQAAQITGSSFGTFSGLSGCDNSGQSQDCRIVTSSSGPNTQVQWGSTNGSNFSNPSSLISVDTSFNAQTNANDLQIAKLSWYNSATLSSETPDFGVTWSLTISFTSPNAASDTELFSLSITNPTNPPGDNISGFTLADLSGLSFNLNGVTISDLKYVAADGTTLTGNGNTKTWNNPENHLGSLYITADFTAVTAVPEPASLAILGVGMLGAGLARARSGRRNAA